MPSKSKNFSPKWTMIGLGLILVALVLGNRGNVMIFHDFTTRDSSTGTISQGNETYNGDSKGEGKSPKDNTLAWVIGLTGTGTLVLEMLKYFFPKKKSEE
jgi:hypothetical protein